MPINPTGDQCRAILQLLKGRTRITPFTALQECGCMRLSERIRELEALGWSIRREWVKIGKKKVMGYSLK